MLSQVQKRKGFEEEFKIEKLRASIEKAAKEAGIPEDEISNIIEGISAFVLESVSDLDIIDTQSLRNLILSELDKTYPQVAEAWRDYDRRVKGRTD